MQDAFILILIISSMIIEKLLGRSFDYYLIYKKAFFEFNKSKYYIKKRIFRIQRPLN